ncbi:hypothetical protein [Cytobacillus horneckiae]
MINDRVNGLTDNLFFEAYQGSRQPAYHLKGHQKVHVELGLSP